MCKYLSVVYIGFSTAIILIIIKSNKYFKVLETKVYFVKRFVVSLGNFTNLVYYKICFKNISYQSPSN